MTSICLKLRVLPSPSNEPRGYSTVNPHEEVSFMSVHSLDWGASCQQGGEWQLCVGYYMERATTIHKVKQQNNNEDHITTTSNKKLKPTITTKAYGLVSCWNVASTTIMWSKE